MLDEALDALFDFATAVGSAASDVGEYLLNLRGAGTDDDPDETADDVIPYGHASILYRPAPEDADGGCEHLFIRRGDELVPVASRDIRWQIDLEEGEVVVRSFGSGAAYIRLRPDGSIVMEGDVNIGAAGATEAVVLGTTLKGHLDDLKLHIDGHTHGFAWTAAAGSAVTTAPSSVPAGVPVDLSPVVPTIESSRHTVD